MINYNHKINSPFIKSIVVQSQLGELAIVHLTDEGWYWSAWEYEKGICFWFDIFRPKYHKNEVYSWVGDL